MHIKPTQAFRLSKTTKRALCSIIDPVARANYKNCMIQAELAAAIKPKSNRAEKETAK